MKVKIDTREKFHAITILEPKLAANMTAELRDIFVPFLQKEVRNLVIIFSEVAEIEEKAAEEIVKIQQEFYDNQTSFVVCEIQKDVEKALDELSLLELMNTTPTESEAWDIVQMEEIEREIMGE